MPRVLGKPQYLERLEHACKLVAAAAVDNPGKPNGNNANEILTICLRDSHRSGIYRTPGGGATAHVAEAAKLRRNRRW